MLVIVNPRAGGGRARARWARIRPDVERRIGPFDEFAGDTIDAVRARVAAAHAGEEVRT